MTVPVARSGRLGFAGWTTDSLVAARVRASTPALAPRRMRALLTVTFSVYVPGHTLTMSPGSAAITAAWIVLKVGLGAGTVTGRRLTVVVHHSRGDRWCRCATEEHEPDGERST